MELGVTNYTFYKEDQYWAPAILRPSLSPDKHDDMHFGAGNNYVVWSFYGRVTAEGKFVHPEEDGFIKKSTVTFYMADSENSILRYIYMFFMLASNF